MTYQTHQTEDSTLKPLARFQNYCTCGGYAWSMNGRPESQPHMDYCPQRQEYAEWYARREKGEAALTRLARLSDEMGLEL